MIIWFTGQPGSGKTTLAKEFISILDHQKLIHIDGDDLRDLMDNKDYSYLGRVSNIKLAQNLALFMESKGFTPVVSLVSPYKVQREEFKSKTTYIELSGSRSKNREEAAKIAIMNLYDFINDL